MFYCRYREHCIHDEATLLEEGKKVRILKAKNGKVQLKMVTSLALQMRWRKWKG